MKLNNKGFTLVELLAVIVILAVVMLIGVTAVGPLMARSRKGALGTEGLAIVKAAQTAFQAEQLNGTIVASKDACFDLQWLKTKGYYEKGTEEGYTGSVYIDYDSNGTYKYSFWIKNSAYAFVNEPSANYVADNGVDATHNNVKSMATCGKTATNGAITGMTYCSNGTGCK